MEITRTMKDVNGTVVTTFADAALVYYNVTLTRRLSGYSFADLTATVFNSAATITIRSPANSDDGTVASSAPFAGYFTITCMDSLSNPSVPIPVTTRDIGWWENAKTISNIISADIPFLSSVTTGMDSYSSDSQRQYW